MVHQSVAEAQLLQKFTRPQDTLVEPAYILLRLRASTCVVPVMVDKLHVDRKKNPSGFWSGSELSSGYDLLSDTKY